MVYYRLGDLGAMKYTLKATAGIAAFALLTQSFSLTAFAQATGTSGPSQGTPTASDIALQQALTAAKGQQLQNVAQEKAAAAKEAAAAAAAAKVEEQKQIQSQQAAQQAAQEKSQKAQQMAQLLGQGLTMAGMMMMMSKNPSTAEIGQYMMMGGIAATLGAGLLGMNANKAGANAGALDTLTPGSVTDPSLPATPINPNGTDPGGNQTPAPIGLTPVNAPAPGLVAVNPGDLYKPPLDKLYTQLEQATGIPRSEIASAISQGKAADLLDGKNGLTKAGIEAGLAKAKANMDAGNGPSLQSLADSAGLGEIAKNVIAETGTDFSGGGGSLASGGGSSGASSIPPLDFAGLMPPTENKDGHKPASDGNFNFQRDVNPEIQKKLIAQGVVRDSLFEMVSSRYRYLTPSLLGYGPTEKKNN